MAGNAGRLGNQYLLATASPEVVHQFSRKKRTRDLCRKLGVPTAVTALVQSRDEALDFARTWNFPIIVKGPDGAFRLRKNGRARIAIASGEEELLNIFDLNLNGRDPGLILQEYIAGDDATVWMFNGYFNEESECLFGATGRKLRQFPAHRGSTSLGICEKNEAVEAQTARLMKAVLCRGPLDMGYRFDARDGQYKLLDVNRRIGSTFRLFAAENGLDVSRVLHLHLTQQRIPRSPVCEGVPEMDCGEQRFSIKLEGYAERRINRGCLVALVGGCSRGSLAGLGRSRAPGNASSAVATKTVSKRKNVIACLSCRLELRHLHRRTPLPRPPRP